MRVGLSTLFLWQTICWQASAQSTSPVRFRLRGYVLDSLTQKALPQATITLLSDADSATRLVEPADEKGQFLVSGKLRQGRYQLQITYVGYSLLRRQITIDAQVPVVDVGVLLMHPLIVRLQEVSVQRRLPITLKRDTVVFNASAYAMPTNAVAEDILRRLPGVTVAADGSVQVLGQQIQQIFVNGQPFFSHDPAVAIRQLPAGSIDKLQLYDRQSDQAALAGVDDGTRIKTLNIVTTPAGRQGQFGQETAGVGPATRYQFGGGINRFRGLQQLSILGQTNNLSQRGYSLPVSSWRTNASAQTQLGGLTQSTGIAVNYNDQWGKRVVITANYLFSDDRTQTQQINRRQTIVPDSTNQSGPDSSRSLLISNRQYDNILRQVNHSINGQLAYQINGANSLQWTVGLTGYQSRTEANQLTRTLVGRQALLNQSVLGDTAVSANRTLTGRLLWTHRFYQPGRTLSLTLSTNRNQQRGDGLNQSQSQFYPQLGKRDSTRTTQLSQRTTQQTNAGDHEWILTYAQPLRAGQIIAMHYTGFINRSAVSRVVIDRHTTLGPAESYNTDLSNAYQSTLMTHRLGSDWQVQRTHYRFTLGIDMQQTNLQSADPVGRNSVDRQYINLLPHIEFSPHLPTNRYLQIHYQTRVSAPSVSQLQPVAIVTNPLIVQRGNPNLGPEYAHDVSINYNQFQATTYRSLFALVTASLVNHRIAPATSVDSAGVQTQQPVNLNGHLAVTGTIALGRPLQIGVLSGTLNLTTRIGLVRGVNLIDSQLGRSTTLSASEEGTLNLALSDRFECTVATSLAYQTASYSLQKRIPNHSVNALLTIGLSALLPLGFRVTTDLTYRASAGQSMGYNQSFILWNGLISHPLFKGQKGEMRLQVVDLLNQNRSLLRTITDTYVEDSQSQVLKRYFLLSLVYNISRFGATNSQ